MAAPYLLLAKRALGVVFKDTWVRDHCSLLNLSHYFSRF